MSNQADQIKKNQETIIGLAASMGLWLGTPQASRPEVKAQLKDLQDRILFRLRELELEGQKVKIDNMTAAIEVIRKAAGVPQAV